MVTQSILEQKNDFKRPVVLESFDIDQGLIAPPVEPCFALKMG